MGQAAPTAKQQLQDEIYRTLVLAGADPILLGAIQSWCAGEPEETVAAALRSWNEAKALELKEWMPSLDGPELAAAQEHLRHYEEAFPPAA